MAKVKSSGLRNYIGRLGGSVYYMLNGQNIARELASQVSNPRTTSQMRQRMQWANLVNTYKANKGWMGRLSFENKPRTQSDYNAFMAANLGVDPVYVTKQMAENGHAILAPYEITRGTLPAIKLENDSDKFVSDIKLGDDFVPSTATVAELSEQIVSHNPEWQYGDQLSIIQVVNANYTPRVYPLEIILSDSDYRELATLSNGIQEGDTLFINYDGEALASSGVEGHSSNYYAMVYVHSRTTGGKTIVSTQSYVLSPNAVDLYNQATTESAFEEAAASYGVTEQPFLASDEAESGQEVELKLKTLEASASVDGDTVIKLMNNGGTNQFGAFTGDVVGGEQLIFRFNRPHEFADSPSVTLSYTKNGGASTSVTIPQSPSIAANYVIIRPSGLTFSSLASAAVVFTLNVDGEEFTISVGA